MAKKNIGTNLRGELDGDTLVLRIKTSHKGRSSKSGKSKIIAKTRERIEWLDSISKDLAGYGLILTLFKSGGKKK